MHVLVVSLDTHQVEWPFKSLLVVTPRLDRVAQELQKLSQPVDPAVEPRDDNSQLGLPCAY